MHSDTLGTHSKVIAFNTFNHNISYIINSNHTMKGLLI